MDKLNNKVSMLLVVAVLFVAGCGKKDKKDKESGKATHKVATADIPTVSDVENLFDEKEVSELAFVDDELDVKDGALARNVDIDRSEIAAQDAEGALSHSFKAVHFNFNRNDIRVDQRDIVAEDVQLAREAVNEGKDVVIEGHTCQMGSAAYNLALSQRRAEAVKVEMLSNGVPAESIKTVGYGYERPLVWSDAPNRAGLIKALAPNRRAEMLIN